MEDNTIKGFRELYNNYLNNKTIENQSVILRSAILDYKYIILSHTEDGEDILDAVRDDKGQLLLKIYTDMSEIEEEKLSNNASRMVDFGMILSIVNQWIIDKVWINPETDDIKITHTQLMDLKRQIEYVQSNEPIVLHEDVDFSKVAYKIKDIGMDFNNDKVIELYKKYLNDNNPDTYNEFWLELINNTSLLSFVLPEDNAELNQEGRALISKNRVLQYNLQDGNKTYLAFIAPKYIKNPSDDEYVSIFNFDDYINLIDSTYDTIKSLFIIGDIRMKIPIEDLYNAKIQKDRIKNNNSNGIDVWINE